MKVGSGEWDVRCPDKLKRLFPKRTGYYYKASHEMAREVLSILSDAYEVPAPKLGKIPKKSVECAMYDYDTRTVLLYSRNHLRSIFHEFYHHLDNVTEGKYNSDDRTGGPSSLAWIFADKLWAQFTGKPRTHTSTKRKGANSG
ncbi:MAG: hypothetical protein ACYTFQ_16395 [Planctomycetota bacterium]|jgi:hypothetical protein